MKGMALFYLIFLMLAVSAGAVSCGQASGGDDEPVTEIQAEIDMRLEYTSWETWHLK